MTEWCWRCQRRRAQREWYISPEEKTGMCYECKRNVAAKREVHMLVYQTFDDVDRTLPNGTYIRIEGMGFYNGVYRIRNGGNHSQGYVWGTYVFPGPAVPKGAGGPRPARLRPWPGNVPPEYRIASDHDDQEV